MQASSNRLLIIDDDRKLCRLIQTYLAPMGYLVEAAHDGPAGLQKAREHSYQAIILDVMLPGMDGFEVLKLLRREHPTPVLMLTSRGDEADRIVGLEIGADDYLPKTASPRELLARIRAVTRRTTGALASAKEAAVEIVVGPIRVDTGAHIATLDGQPLVLTPVEFGLLASLARACGRVKSREQLLEEFADRNFDVFDRSIDVHISSLRKKLGDDPKNPRFIKTVRSAGYLLIKPGVAPP
jgi:DNA-binding response OmpR family regulator